MTTLAQRMQRLGTETAFAVSAEAAAFAAQGNKVYPFHLGDMNIKTPENIIAATKKAMDEGRTGYCSNYGIAPLRELLATDLNKDRGSHYRMENIAIQPGGKPVISKFMMTLMNPGDEVLYPSPGYPIYESQIDFHGGVGVPYTFRAGRDGFELDVAAMEKLVTPKTKILVFNNLQNPMGAESSHEELKAVADLVRRHNLWVLCDEAYFDIRYEGKSESLVSFPDMEERCIILYTFSKKYAMTGWRLGAAVGPKDVIDAIAKLNVNDESCTNHFIQFGVMEGITGDQSGPRRIIRTLQERRDMAVKILNSIDGVKCYQPHATFYLFPNVTGLMQRLGYKDYGALRTDILKHTGVSFCTRLHFGRELPGENQKHVRLAYSGINVDQIEEGLNKFKKFVERN